MYMYVYFFDCQCHLKSGDTEEAVEWLDKAGALPTVTTEVSPV